MEIPKKIKIKGIEFDIKFEDLGDKLFGNYDALDKIIRLNTKACKEHNEITLIHEIFHVLDIDIKESIVEKFAWDLWQVLKENNLLR